MLHGCELDPIAPSAFSVGDGFLLALHFLEAVPSAYWDEGGRRVRIKVWNRHSFPLTWDKQHRPHL